jgi:4-amino-4-deoxy-L-arabinose transferase-like glycosyltransferase
MQSNKYIRASYIFASVFLLNLLQAVFTPIAKDEAYYYMYAQNPGWGYFDHPPMIAWLIGVGDFFFDGILAVRGLTVLLSVLLIGLLWRFTTRRNARDLLLLTLIVWSIPVFHIYGFISTPDVPLLFFGTLYLFVLERFKSNPGWKNAIMLGISMALLMYSKYHGALLIFFSLILLPSLWKKKYLYLAVLTGILLYIPHILWQAEHDFVTLRFHLFERNTVPLTMEEKLKMSLGGMLLILNPLLIYLVIKSLIYNHKDNQVSFYKKLFLSVLFFFTLYSFFSWVQAHWIAIAAIPMALVTYHYVNTHEDNRNRFYKLMISSIFIIFLLRIALILPLRTDTEFHKERKAYFKEIKRLAGNNRVVFINSYQRAAKYTFYTGDSAFSLNTIYYRKNQYDLWNYDGFHNKKVLIAGGWPLHIYHRKKVGEDEIYYTVVDSFKVFNRLKTIVLNKDELYHNDTVKILVRNPHKHKMAFGDGKYDLKMFLTTKIKDKFEYHQLVATEKTVVDSKSTDTLKFVLQNRLNTNIPLDNYFVTVQFYGFHVKTGR